MKGNRIQSDVYADYPSKTTLTQYDGLIKDDYAKIIRDNRGPFVLVQGKFPGSDATDGSGQEGTVVSDIMNYSTSNYQFYSDAWDGNSNGESLDGADGDGTFNKYMNLVFLDTGLPDGPRHPFDTAKSLDTKHKYSTILNGRQFAGNVKITSEEETEEYPNFVMFSDVGSPDIIPVSNFIQLQDLQGGEIVGIETLMSDLVVFMTNGVFRLSVPSNNPASWSLVEAHQNIGALHDKGIVKTQNGIFFLSQSDIFYLDSGFTLTSISDPIKDVYQSGLATLGSAGRRLHHNIKYN